MKQEDIREQPAAEETEDESESKPCTPTLQQRKELIYDRIPVTRRQIDIILWVAVAALVVVIILIALEAMGIYKIGK